MSDPEMNISEEKIIDQQHDENLENAVIASLDKKVTDFNAAFQNIMNMKLADRVALLKSNLATKLFNPGGAEPVTAEEVQSEDGEELTEKNWIAGAIKHPGAEKRAAKKAGESTHEYEEKHKDAPGKAGKRARLGLELTKFRKK